MSIGQVSFIQGDFSSNNQYNPINDASNVSKFIFEEPTHEEIFDDTFLEPEEDYYDYSYDMDLLTEDNRFII